MMTYALTIEAVRKLNPCGSDIRRVEKLLPKRRKLNAAQAREFGCTYEDIIWVASAVAKSDEALARILTHFVNDNAKAVLHIFENKFPDNLPRKAIEACDKFLAGLISEGEWREAAKASRDAGVARSTWDAWYAWYAWGVREAWGARYAWYAWKRADREAFAEWQFDRLVYWLTADHPEPLPMPEKGKPCPIFEGGG